MDHLLFVFLYCARINLFSPSRNSEQTLEFTLRHHGPHRQFFLFNDLCIRRWALMEKKTVLKSIKFLTLQTELRPIHGTVYTKSDFFKIS